MKKYILFVFIFIIFASPHSSAEASVVFPNIKTLQPPPSDVRPVNSTTGGYSNESNADSLSKPSAENQQAAAKKERQANVPSGSSKLVAPIIIFFSAAAAAILIFILLKAKKML